MEDNFAENIMKQRLASILAQEKTEGKFMKAAKLHKVPRRVRGGIKEVVEDFLESLINSDKMCTLKRLSQSLQDFYIHVTNHLDMSIYKGLCDNDRYKIMELVESYVTEQVNKIAFGLIAVQNKNEDASIQRIIDHHYWIAPKHIDAEINLDRAEVRKLLLLAISDLIEMNFKESTLDKLNCILQCSNRINLMFKLCNNRHNTADDYLPILHFVVLKANPPLLESNIKFIYLFSYSHRLQTEERGYCFTSLYAIVRAIENMNSNNLNITREEYDRLLSLRRTRIISPVQLLYGNVNEVAPLSFNQVTRVCEPLNLSESLRKAMEAFSNHFWFTFQKSEQIGITNELPLVHELRTDDKIDEVEEAIEIGESYAPHVTMNDVLEEYIIIPDSAVGSVAPYF